MPKLKLYKDSDGHEIGYEAKLLYQWMKKRQFLKAWEDWYIGSTGMIIDGKLIVYKWDVKGFLEGRPNLD